ncbi:class I SAM-dependent methyltransferase [Methylomicrobium sp. RS1]|uniref:class I SAM-dependent methyltransferase n=1 Tax=Candidatus Methylomicrobium oryzae TaxID=2802053 RepID=UPI0019221181|nr:class I SAM-dependent methyltransferase [Methylomicrobium sp. RS1]MBL1265320.1 class I SAM-dependent methyltransferase [Methylomicrobium sp. RS1]
MDSVCEKLLESANFKPYLFKKNSAWLGHLPFAAWLIQIYKPSIFVELGTHWGHSYFSFCQSVYEANLATQCYAIDTWQGDEHAGQYGDEVFHHVNVHNQEHYAGFSRLLRMTFDEALNYFSDASIELLHIDGLHTYEAVNHDFESWLPKLAPGAVVLFHDINVRERGFGVWKLWEELQIRYPNTLEFLHSHGLGILQLDGATEAKKLVWLNCNTSEKLQLKNYFAALGARQWERFEFSQIKIHVNHLSQSIAERDSNINSLGQVIAARDEQIVRLNQTIAEYDAQLTYHKQTVADRDNQIANLNQVIAQHDGLIANLNRIIADYEGQLVNLQNTVAKRDMQILQAQSTVKAILESTSWKLTAPIRFFGKAVRHAKKAYILRKSIFDLALRYSRRHSVFELFKRTFYIMSKEGLEGIRSRLRDFNSNPHKPESKLANTLEKPAYQPLSSIDINKYEYFFFDVFDTAIIRLFQRPIDLFEYISVRTEDPEFHIRRIQKETKTRELFLDRKDISIFEIYKDFADASIDEEIATELKFCVANPEVYLFYSKLLSAGKKIYFISDMYLNKSTIAEMLERNGFSVYADIFVSSEDDYIKGDGSRFEWLKKSLPSCIGNAIHIGDNIIADFMQPTSYGFDAIHYMESHAYYQHDSFLNSKIEFLNSKQSLGLSFLISVFRYWKSGFHDQVPNYWRQFGFLFGGALVSVFCGFINSQILKNKLSCNKIFFLARDGDIMSQIYRLFYDDVEAAYLMASRRCMSFPSLIDLSHAEDVETLKLFTTTIGVSGTKDILERFGYTNLGDLEADLKKIGPDPSKWAEPMILECFLRNKKSILEKAITERRVLFDYLSKINFFDQKDIVIVDVGWGGSIQNSLVKLLKLWGYEKKNLHGIYLGVNDKVAHKNNKVGFLFNGDQTHFAEYFNLIELITSSPQNGIVRIDYANGTFFPISGTVNEHEKQRQFVAAEIQKGIIDFAQIVKEQDIAGLDFIRPYDFQALFESLRDHASEEDIVQFRKLKHAMMIGNNYTHTVLNLKPQQILS